MARIGINAVPLDPSRTGGAETYVRRLLQHLPTLEGAEQYVVFASPRVDPSPYDDRLEWVPCDVDPAHPYRRILWEQRKLTRVIAGAGIDLMHFPYNSLPLGYGGPAVVTLHDAVLSLAPETLSRAERFYKTRMERNIARRGRHVIFPSRAGVDTLVEKGGFAREKVHAVHHGIDASLFQSTEERDGNMDGQWDGSGGSHPSNISGARRGVLWVGRPYPTKNLSVLLKAIKQLDPGDSSKPLLTLLGASGSGPTLRQALETAGVDDGKATVLPDVPHEHVHQHYRNARVFCYPSTIESFGLPVLEAMACGTPVVCSDIPVFREICEDAATYVAHDNADAFAQAIQGLLQDDDLWRQRSEAGIHRARKLTWRQCAIATREVYRKVLGG